MNDISECRLQSRSTNSIAMEFENDSELVARMRAGDENACEIFVRTFGPRILAVARRMLTCETESADAVQDAFLSAFQSLESFRGDSQLATWLHRIAVNACLMRIRSQRRRPVVRMDDLLPKFDETGHQSSPVARCRESAHDMACSAEMRSLVRRSIEQLPKIYREIVLLRDIEQLDTVETARLLGVSEAVVKTRLHRARQALRTMLEPLLADVVS